MRSGTTMRMRIGRLSGAALVTVLLLFRQDQAAPQRIVFPSDPFVLNVKTNFGAAGNGTTDDTQALQRALDSSSSPPSRAMKAIYLPKGTYRVRQSLIVNRNATGFGIGPFVYGEHRDSVIIRLDNGALDTGAVIKTWSILPGSADWFMRSFYNFTVDVGNNPRVDGINYYSNNAGVLRDIRVKGSKGSIGIRCANSMNGPNLIQDVEIEGFRIGILSEWLWGQTISNATIRNCDSVGLIVNANVASVESLKVSGTPVAVSLIYPGSSTWWAGYASLVDCIFTGKDPTKPAITNSGMIHARNIKTTGFSKALHGYAGNYRTVDDANITEFVSHPVRKLFPNTLSRSLNLPIKREPRIPWETDLNKWHCANNQGARAGDNTDDAAALQAAFDAAAAAGKTTVYLRGGESYIINSPVYVHGSVRHVMGLGWTRIYSSSGTFPNIGRFVMDSRSAPVVKFENFQPFGGTLGFENRSANTMVIDNAGGVVMGRGTGDIFITNSSSHLHVTTPGQKVWARQLNPEGIRADGLVHNSGGIVWILGKKTEGEGTMSYTAGGGKTEVLGFFNYSSPVAQTDTRPVFVSNKSQISFSAMREYTPANKTAPLKVRETRNDTTKELSVIALGEWDERWACPLFSGIPGIDPVSATNQPWISSGLPAAWVSREEGGLVNVLGRRTGLSRLPSSSLQKSSPKGVFVRPDDGRRFVLIPE